MLRQKLKPPWMSPPLYFRIWGLTLASKERELARFGEWGLIVYILGSVNRMIFTDKVWLNPLWQPIANKGRKDGQVSGLTGRCMG